MGKTVESYRMALEAEIHRWDGFARALRKEDREAFEEMMDMCRSYAMASSNATNPIVFEPMIMSMVLFLQRRINQLEKQLSAIDSSIPRTLFDALQVDTSDLKEGGWSQAPGSKWVYYSLPERAFVVTPMEAPSKASARPRVARYAVSSKVPLIITDAIDICDLIHLALVKLSDGSEQFTGCDLNGMPVKKDHAFILCHCEPATRMSRPGQITNVTVYSKLGFDEREQGALRSLSVLRGGKAGYDINLALIGMGPEDSFTRPGQRTDILSSSDRWISLTPFIPTRCPKFTRAGVPKCDASGLQIGSAEHDLRRLLKLEGFPEPIAIRPIPMSPIIGKGWLHFRRIRHSSKRRPLTIFGFGYEVVFDHPVSGPIAVGYGNHYGLGLFIPQASR